MEDIIQLITYIGFALFVLPAMLFITMTWLMLKDLMKEDETVKTLIKIGIGLMITGAIILLVRYFFFA